MQFRRRSIRLPEYDYSSYGWYFVTICAQDRELYFENDDVKQMIENMWTKLPTKFDVDLDEYVVMPNRLHVIVVIKKNDNVGARFIVPRRNEFDKSGFDQSGRDKSRPYNIRNNPMSISDTTLGKILRYYKAKTTYEIHKYIGDQFVKFGYFQWQRNYYERIIRNNKELNRIRQYIINNPDNWETDRNNPKNFNL